MDNIRWNEEQLKAYRKLFENKEGIKLENLYEKITPITNIWQKIYETLVKSGDFEITDSIMKVKECSYKERDFLVFQVMPSHYIIIDMDKGTALNGAEANVIIGIDFFTKYFPEEDNIDHIYYDPIKRNNAAIILDIYRENKNILNTKNYIHYKQKYQNINSSIRINLDTKKTIIEFISDEGDVNYIFLNSELLPIGVSNPTGNIEKLKEIAFEAKDIIIPYELIPEEIITGELTLQKKPKND